VRGVDERKRQRQRERRERNCSNGHPPIVVSLPLFSSRISILVKRRQLTDEAEQNGQVDIFYPFALFFFFFWFCSSGSKVIASLCSLCPYLPTMHSLLSVPSVLGYRVPVPLSIFEDSKDVTDARALCSCTPPVPVRKNV